MQSTAIVLQAFVAASVFFVWVVRYDNIREEFTQYGLPDWLRDFVGILKLGAVVQPLFSAFGEEALFQRMDSSKTTTVITQKK